jgi:hypothetical protein
MKGVAALHIAENAPRDTGRARAYIAVYAACFAYVNKTVYVYISYYRTVYAHGFGFAASKTRGMNRKPRAYYRACRSCKFVLYRSCHMKLLAVVFD